MSSFSELNPTPKLLLGPGPSMVHPRVLCAMNTPLIGHLDPEFLAMMNDVQDLLRWLFQTQNRSTFAVSGTGSAAMETTIVNLVEPGDFVIVGIKGVFGTRLSQMVVRCGGKPIPIEVPWGHVIPPSAIEQCLKSNKPVKAVALVHAETSTGVRQPIEDLASICHEHGALLLVDAVTSLGGLPVNVDEWGTDACYSATKKCLSCPPGLSPLTLNDRAIEVIKNRTTPCQSWYLDCSLFSEYWNESKRTYHHTAPISMIYALRESLRIIHEERLEVRFARHRKHSKALLAGLQALGFKLFPHPEFSLPTLICVTLPTFVEDRSFRSQLLRDFRIEIGGGWDH